MLSRLLYYEKCPAHEDETPSFAIYDDGHGHCFTCGYHDNHLKLARPIERVVRPRYEGPLPWSMVEQYERQLQGMFNSRIGWLWGRGLRTLTVEKLHLGHTGKAFSIPVWDHDGTLLTVRYRRDDRLVDETEPKYKGLAGSKRSLYGLWQATSDRTVVLCEGELDAALLMQELWRYSLAPVAMAVTGGSHGLSPDLAARLAVSRVVLVAYDQDVAGRQGALSAGWDLQSAGGEARVLEWPPEWGKDITEAMKNVGPAVWLEQVLGRWL